LAAGLFYFLFKKINGQQDFNLTWLLLKEAPFSTGAWKFWLTIMFIFINWSLEARKWQILITQVQPMHFFTALKSVLCGVTLTFFTPNRIGEYGGRVLFVADGHRFQAVSLSIAGGISQLIITLLMGCFGLVYLLLYGNHAVLIMGISFFWLKILLYGAIIVTITMVLFFFRLSWLIRLVERLPYAYKFSGYISVLENFNIKILVKLLSLSLARYIVFVLQYVIMLQLLQVEQNFWQGFWLITVLFLLLAIIPSFAVAELGIRGTVASTLFAYTGNSLGVLTVIFGIWFINLFIPALAGSLLILGIKITKDR
jgi:hypothetical protein